MQAMKGGGVITSTCSLTTTQHVVVIYWSCCLTVQLPLRSALLVSQTEVHRLPPPGTACAMCHAMEAPGAHMDQAKALRSSGLSNRGLGPLMPVCLPPAKQAASGNTASGMAQPHAAGAAGAEADSRPAAESAATSEPAAADGAAAPTGSALAAEGEVVWVHRQCALWSPEVYPDKSGVLVSVFQHAIFQSRDVHSDRLISAQRQLQLLDHVSLVCHEPTCS
jgi:hypothetical protein